MGRSRCSHSILAQNVIDTVKAQDGPAVESGKSAQWLLRGSALSQVMAVATSV